MKEKEREDEDEKDEDEGQDERALWSVGGVVFPIGPEKRKERKKRGLSGNVQGKEERKEERLERMRMKDDVDVCRQVTNLVSWCAVHRGFCCCCWLLSLRPLCCCWFFERGSLGRCLLEGVREK